MKKWQAKQKQKVHDNIVQNAKSTIKRYSNSKEHALSSSRSKHTPLNKQLPINRILQFFQLQQYAFLLAEYGFPHKLVHQKSRDFIEEMLHRVDEEDQQRFLSLLNTLTVMSKDIKRPVKTPNVLHSKKSTNFPASTSKHSPPSLQKSQKTTSKFRIKNSVSNHRENILQSRSKRPPKAERQRTVTNKYNRKKSVSYSRPAHDDFSVVHDFRNYESGEVRPTQDGNHLIKKLIDKLDSIEEKKQGNYQQIHLNMEHIRQMYKSFDSGKITSNIGNIDLQLMIDCLSHQIYDQLQLGNLSMMAKCSQEKIKALLQQSFLQIQNEKTEQKQQKSSEELQKISKRKNIEGFLQKEIDQVQIYEEISEEKKCQPLSIQVLQQGQQRQSALEEDYATDNSEGSCSIDVSEPRNNESSVWGNSYIQSIINDFSCFDSTSAPSENKTQRADIKNFIELVVMAGKMEKQIPIIAHVYLKRLLKMTKSKGGRITQKNWKNITLIVLIEGSKIWDDQSLQNHSFSKIVKPYTTLQINRLQKYLLYFIDYTITINQKQYSKSYFQMRKHTPNSMSTANLMKLDLRTIQKLQNTTNKVNYSKQQYMKKCMNKSF